MKVNQKKTKEEEDEFVDSLYNVVQNPQTILLSEKERMVSVRGVKRSGMLLPQRSQGGTLDNL